VVNGPPPAEDVGLHTAEAAADTRTVGRLGRAFRAWRAARAGGALDPDDRAVRAEVASLRAEFRAMHARDRAGAFDPAEHQRFRAHAERLIAHLTAPARAITGRRAPARTRRSTVGPEWTTERIRVGATVRDLDGVPIGTVVGVRAGLVLEVAAGPPGGGRRYWIPTDTVHRVDDAVWLRVMRTDLALYQRPPEHRPD
jgi:hypothetical protein